MPDGYDGDLLQTLVHLIEDAKSTGAQFQRSDWILPQRLPILRFNTSFPRTFSECTTRSKFSVLFLMR
jgi:hypothetical protein